MNAKYVTRTFKINKVTCTANGKKEFTTTSDSPETVAQMYADMNGIKVSDVVIMTTEVEEVRSMPVSAFIAHSTVVVKEDK